MKEKENINDQINLELEQITVYFIAVKKENKEVLTEEYFKKSRNIIRYLKSLT